MTLPYGASFDQALALVTTGPAGILGIDDRVGTLEVGKDGDVALFDGDPFEYTTQVLGTIIEGRRVSERRR
jgi:imidazolonepropionase-like amidohydrolase